MEMVKFHCNMLHGNFSKTEAAASDAQGHSESPSIEWNPDSFEGIVYQLSCREAIRNFF